MYDQLISNSRISGMVHILPDPIGYMGGIIANFVSFGCDPEASRVRIGITGKGDAPNYKIEEPNITFTLFVHSLSFEMPTTPARTFNGRNHREMAELDDQERHDKNWSTETMSFAELKNLLSRLGVGANIKSAVNLC